MEILLPADLLTDSTRRGLYMETQPFKSGFLPEQDGHAVYFEECGRPNGKPCVILHGGPGGAINPTMRRYFDPSRWHMVLFDQRGCGRSLPTASLEYNTTWSLIEDIERLRVAAGVEKWTVFGGSWGSTLALAYAITHPDRVESLILRGIFTGSKRELDWFYQDGANMLFPDVWERYIAHIPHDERGDLMQAFHKRLTGTDQAAQVQAAADWSQWEGDTLSIRGPVDRPDKFNDTEFAVAFARIECHYFVNSCFFPHDRWIQSQIASIRHIPAWIVQGRYDVVTPLETAWGIKAEWPEAKFDLIWDAGHASTEPGTVDALVRATDAAFSI
jgi:proline iminopeptidase